MIYPRGHNTKSKVVLPKCTAKGYTLAYCTVSGCDYTVKYNYTDALGHNTKDTCATPPDCTTQGKRKYTVQDVRLSHMYQYLHMVIYITV